MLTKNADIEAMGNRIVSYLYDLYIQACNENPDAPQQVFYDREVIRFAMGIEDEGAFIQGLIWAEQKGWITAQQSKHLQ